MYQVFSLEDQEQKDINMGNSGSRTDKNLDPLDYFGFSKNDIDHVVCKLNKGDFWGNEEARKFIQMVKTLLRDDRYRLLELMTTSASFASVVLQIKQKHGRRGAKVMNQEGRVTNWILEFCLQKSGVWPKVFQKLSIDNRFIKDDVTRRELVMLQSKMPKTSPIGIATALSLKKSFH